MKIKGKYRDILTSNGIEAVDTGWRSNTIVEDFGRFMAALMKKDSNFDVTTKELTGVDYIAFAAFDSANFGNVGDTKITDTDLKTVVQEMLRKNTDPNKLLDPFHSTDSTKPINFPLPFYVWAKKIEKDSIKYLDTNGNQSNSPTNEIGMTIVVEELEPPKQETLGTLYFKEFCLFGVAKKPNGSINPDFIFFINHVVHEFISKTPSLKLTRAIRLKFEGKCVNV